MAFGALLCALNKQFLAPDYFAAKSYRILKIWISSEPQQTNGILRFNAEVIAGYEDYQPYKVSGILLIALQTDSLKPIKLNYGNELMVAAKYLPVAPPYNPAEFDFRAWLASKNCYQQAFVKQNQVIKLGGQNGSSVIKYALDLRKRQVEIYRKIIKNDEAFAVASTLILGYRADLSGETLAAYSKTGTIHALSVSGMHVGIIYIVLNWLLLFLDRNSKLRLIKITIICLLIWFYALLTGFSPSVLRSAMMLTVYILAKSFNRPTNGYNILAFTAFCLLIYNPFLIWDVGFQLSFLAVLGLLYLQPKIYKWCYFKHRWADRLWSSVALSIAAQIATFPLSVYYFHQFPLYFIFSNLFLLLPVTLLMYLGIIILLFKFYFLAPVFEWIIIFLNSGLKWIANLPVSGISGVWFNRPQLFLLSFALFLFLIALANSHKKSLMLSLLGLLAFQLLTVVHQFTTGQQKKILFFSLKKNYAVAFINARTAILLTNLTESDKNYRFHIEPALSQIRIKTVVFIKWEADTTLAHFKKKDHQLHFYQYKILLYDPYFNARRIAGHRVFDMVWFHQNPEIAPSTLYKNIIFHSLIIDASNRDYNIDKYRKDANKIRLQPYILKKNKAYLIDLNN